MIASILYSAATTFGMMAIGYNMVDVIEQKNQAEADFKYVVARVNTRTTLRAACRGRLDPARRLRRR